VKLAENVEKERENQEITQEGDEKRRKQILNW
jgi:hypothetical protein